MFLHKIFCDTNIWFSAIYRSSNCEKLLRAHLEHKVSLVMSQQVLKELIKNVHKKIPQVIPDLEKIFTSRLPEIVNDPETIPKRIKKLVSFADQGIFVSCQKSEIKYFVTGNIKDFKIKELEKLTGIKILTPKDAVEILGL